MAEWLRQIRFLDWSSHGGRLTVAQGRRAGQTPSWLSAFLEPWESHFKAVQEQDHLDGVERYFPVWKLAFHLRSQFDHQHIRFQAYRRLFSVRWARPNLCDLVIRNFHIPSFYRNDCTWLLWLACLQLFQIHYLAGVVHPFRIYLQATPVADRKWKDKFADEYPLQGRRLLRRWVLGVSLLDYGTNQHFAFSGNSLQHVWVGHRCILCWNGDFAFVLTRCKQDQRQHSLQAHEAVRYTPRIHPQRHRRNQTHQSAMSRAVFRSVSKVTPIGVSRRFQQVLRYQDRM